MADRVKLTKDRVNKMLAEYQASGETGRKDVYDSETRGFMVRLSATKGTYCVAKRVNGKMTRVTIGDHGVYLPDHANPKLNARKLAQSIIADMNTGENPNEIKKERRAQGLTLQEALDNYFLDNPKLKPRTVKEYRSMLQNHVPSWMNKPIKNVTPDMVQKLHTKLTREQKPEQANKVVRTLRAIFYQNKALLPENPACLPRKKWNKSERRTRVVKDFQLPDWYVAIRNYRNQDIADYLMLLLFTGMRRSEGFSLLWEDVDLKSKTLIARDTKNGKPHTMPLSDYLCELLERRKADKVNAFVFPSFSSKSGHLVEPKKVLAAVVKTSGIKFSFHDLRRTFMSAAAALGISETLIKRLVNHSVQDVTGGYIFSIEHSGPHQRMQEITDLIMGFVTRPAAVILAVNLLLDQEAKRAAKVISLDEHRRVVA
ncbi:tyrosine-type recombinase/integrase [Trichlorobacter lovleyi]|uniref:tyrosine-type recombinase/integrase n=1 Tax=Trichlorobacter lovleyi TaxID=313985 RepID=UPI003D0B0C70